MGQCWKKHLSMRNVPPEGHVQRKIQWNVFGKLKVMRFEENRVTLLIGNDQRLKMYLCVPLGGSKLPPRRSSFYLIRSGLRLKYVVYSITILMSLYFWKNFSFSFKTSLDLFQIFRIKIRVGKIKTVSKNIIGKRNYGKNNFPRIRIIIFQE